jgi:ankyrin repeat protein
VRPEPSNPTNLLLGWPLQEGWTPLHKAAEDGRKEVVVLLLDAGAAVDATTKVRPPPHTMHDRLTAAQWHA